MTYVEQLRFSKITFCKIIFREILIIYRKFVGTSWTLPMNFAYN